jgi:serine/threonine-protein kinase RsbT
MPTYTIREALDVYEPRRIIQPFCAKIGFTRSDCQELTIVISELGSNIVKYGRSGSIAFEAVNDAYYGRGVLVVARDFGPPFHDLKLALRDGYDDRGPIDPGRLLTRGGLGTGLGAVLRLSDSFEVEYEPDGKRISTARYLKRPLGLKAKYE